MSESNLQSVFNDVVSGDKRRILFRDKRDFESTRTALLRKFRRYKALITDLGGADPFEGRFFRCAWNPDDCSGCFYLEADERRQNRTAKPLQVVDL